MAQTDPPTAPPMDAAAMGLQVADAHVETEETGRGNRFVGRVLGKLPVYEKPE